MFAKATSVEIAYLGRFLIGFGVSVGFLGSLALGSKWFPPQRFAFLAGLAMFAGMDQRYDGAGAAGVPG